MRYLYKNGKVAELSFFSALALLVLFLLTGNVQAQTPYRLADGTYTESFSSISTWTTDFATGSGASPFSKAYPDPVLPNTNTVFASGTGGGVQKGTATSFPGTIILLATGTTNGQNASAFDLSLDFSGTIAGTLTLDWSSVNNSTGDRSATFLVQTNTGADGKFVELPGTNIVITNNVPTSGQLVNITLPEAFNNNPSAKLRFYLVTSAPGSTGSRPKISLDNLEVTATADGRPSIRTAAVSASSFCVTPSAGSTPFTVAYSTTGSFAGNWAVQLSDKAGSFSSDLTTNLIGTGTGTSPITASIPAGTPGGTGYRVRVINSDPETIGSASSAALSVTLAPASNMVSVTPSGDQSFSPEEAGTLLTASAAAVSGFQWLYGTSQAGPFTTTIAGATSSTFQPTGSSFNGTGTFYVVARATSVCGEVVGTSGPVKVSVVQATAPGMVVSATSLATFGNMETGTASGMKSFTVEGSNLTGPITITPPAGFEIRIGTGPFACCVLTLSPQNGTVPSTTVEVRFAPTAAQSYSTFVTVSGGGVPSQEVAVTGTGEAAIYPPTLTTALVTEVTTTSATTGGTVVEDGGSPVTARGVVWSLEANPTVTASKTENSGSTETFTSNLSGLTHNTTYFVRAYATNAAGTSYGEQIVFKTEPVVLASEPTSPAAITFSQVVRNSMLLTLTGGNGTKHLVLAREATPVDALPEDAIAYTANASFKQGQQLGTGNYVVFNGTGREVNVTGLKSGTTYHFAVVEYNDNNTLGAQNYLTTTVGRANQTTEALVGGLLFEENFAYNAGSRLTENGWAAHSGTTGFIMVAQEGLSYPDYESTTGLAAVMNANGEDVNRTFEKVEAGAPVYASFLVNVASAKAAGEYFFHLAPQVMGSNFRARVFVRSSANGIQFGISGSGSNTTAAYTTEEYSLNTTYLLVVRYDFDATGNTSRLFIDPAVKLEPATANASVTEAGTTSPTDIGSVALRQGTNFPVLTIDGLRVGTAYSSVHNGIPVAPPVVLPVELAYFKARAASGKLRLLWATATENNTDRFEIERSANGEDYTKIGQVQAHGTSQELKEYVFTDGQPLTGRSYYRLKLVDLSGASGYSQALIVDSKAPSSGKNVKVMAVYPNPISGNEALSLQVMLTEDEDFTLTLTDNTGRIIHSQVVMGEAGAHIILIDRFKQVPAGIYYLRVGQGAETATHKIVKMN